MVSLVGRLKPIHHTYLNSVCAGREKGGPRDVFSHAPKRVLSGMLGTKGQAIRLGSTSGVSATMLGHLVPFPPAGHFPLQSDKTLRTLSV